MKNRPKLSTSVEFQIPFDEDPPMLRRICRWILRSFLRRGKISNLIKAFASHHELQGIIMLITHAKTEKGIYVYGEKHKRRRIQDWIDKHDGKAAVLIIAACNPSNSPIHSRRSIILHADCAWCYFDFVCSRKKMLRAYVPGAGYVEDDYRKLNRLTKKFKSAH
jgi:hypothetical protein